MTTHYRLLGIPPAAAADEVKRAFRREVARYHPDKVQHLGQEFQEMATARAAALTEAYRILIDEDLRRKYDAHLAATGETQGTTEEAAGSTEKTRGVRGDRPPATGRRADDAATVEGEALELVKRAVVARLNAGASALGGAGSPSASFDAVFTFRGKKRFLRDSAAGARVAVKVVPRVDAAAVQRAWPAAARGPVGTETSCLLLLGSGLAPAGELAASVSDLRRRTRGTAPLLVAVDIRDWQALMPPEAPPAVRALLERVRRGD